MDLSFALDVDSKDACEQIALLANDVRVLAGQLNDAIKRASEQKLRIEANVNNVMDLKSVAGAYPVLSVRIFSEVQ